MLQEKINVCLMLCYEYKYHSKKDKLLYFNGKEAFTIQEKNG